ncbi:MAG: TIGR01244 family phosphatase [Hyphomicrobiaceae bacterium]|nr:TIGR01244 family phosphatase [Hyphomicrobiaceae bacterium]
MQDIVYITPNFAVTGSIDADDFARIAELGFKAVINNRPDGEEDGQLSGQTAAPASWRAGLIYRHIPVNKLEMFTDPVVGAMHEALAELDGPVLAHCKSGIRSAIVWAAARSRTQSVDDVLAALEKAEFDLDFLRDDLEQQADRARWMPAALPATAADGLATNGAATNGLAAA